MKIKSIIPPGLVVTIVIMGVLGLNAIATTIDHPELRQTQIEQSELVPVIEVELDDYVKETFASYGLDADIVRAVIAEESGWNASAEGDDGEAIGLMQIQPRWHQERMKRLGVTNLYDPVQNITVGCDILAENLEKYGNYKDALSVYNSGDIYTGRDYAERILENARK